MAQHSVRVTRRQLLLGAMGAALTAACGEVTPPATPTPAGAAAGSPTVAASPQASPASAATPTGPSTNPAAGPSPLPAPGGSSVAGGPSLIVPGRVPSPSPGPVASPGASPAPSPSPMPMVLGRPGLLAVESDGKILLVDPEQQRPVRVLVASPGNRAPVWSPDGRRVLFVGGVGPAAELRLIGESGGPLRRLTANARPERAAAWSPRGDQIAYTLPRGPGPDGAPDLSEPEEVWLLDASSGTDRKLADGFDPAWSPDGRWIAYATNGQRDGQGPRDNAIRVVSTNGQDDRPLLAVSDLPADLLAAFELPFKPATVRLRAPAWSPTGQLLAASADGHTSFAVTCDVRGQGVLPWALAYEGGVGQARWSPDGARLAIESRPATGVAVIVLADLSSRRELGIGGHEAGFQALGPAWSPDGRRLAAIAASLPARHDEPREATLRLFGLDGAALSELLTAPSLANPDWGQSS